MNVSDAIRQRTSIRAFTPAAVPEALLRELLDVARHAPSGGNLQPWKVIAVAGDERRAVIDAVGAALRANPQGEVGERRVYPDPLWSPYRERRYEVGEALYATLGITREDKPARYRQFARNLEFFGAPVGLFFVIDTRMGHGQWAHLGMFMQTLALAAQERGLSTCMQEYWAQGRDTLKRHFALPEQEMIYCAMALGYADPDAPVNALRASRVAVEAFAEFRGF